MAMALGVSECKNVVFLEMSFTDDTMGARLSLIHYYNISSSRYNPHLHVCPWILGNSTLLILWLLS